MTSQSFNTYGDQFIPTTGQHGADISKQRTDGLDQACLGFVESCIETCGALQAIDIGGGSGSQSKRMAVLGASVLLVDLTDQDNSVRKFNDRLGRQAIKFVCQDVREIRDWPEGIGCVYSQRTLNYLPYHDALRLLVSIQIKSISGAHFFLSTGGLNTEYGVDYSDRHKPVENRFTLLPALMATKHNICVPQCLYDESELKKLAENAGLRIQRSWTSTFGNPKVIAVKP